MNNTSDSQGGQPDRRPDQGFDASQTGANGQGQYQQPSDQYQGQSQQYSQPDYAQDGASWQSQSSQQTQFGQGDYQQPGYTQPYYGQPNYQQPGYAQSWQSQPGYGYTAGNGGQPYAPQNGYPQGQPYAPQYGQPQPLPYGYQPRSKMVAGLLGVFLGWLGVHNFYLGYYAKAVTQLLLTLIGWILFGLGPVAAFIWGLIEGVLILSSNYGSPWHRDAKGVELRE
ncbi:NINE protein [Bifidobacterium sp. ESL0682]|uniref:NINE protein n=1 Tax=Bifidobacterium sp. ESL0682 TaxID=2983212 RepID=UPI0023F7EE5D|nr:NINE protein [Bifidobacterium sp. ESL0682]WEV42257.1 NINE protein [Bifidobacterium sp. ESL0682]